MKKTNIMWLCESAVMIAASTVLSFFAIIKMPFGGSVTAFSMVPVILIAYRYGTLRGLATGLVHGILQLIIGASTLSYATSLGAAIAIVLLDYLFAFSALGLGGVFRKTVKSQYAALVCGAALCCAVRYLMHVISGCTVWAGVSIPSSDGLLYSLSYNAAYMIPETVVTIAGVFYLGRTIDFRPEKLGRINSEETNAEAVFSAVSLLVIIATVLFDALKLFAATQTEEGFDITAISGAPFTLIGIITAVGLVLGVVLYIIGKKMKSVK